MTPVRQTMTLDEAATALRLSKQTVRAYIAAGQLSAYRVGPRAIRLDAAEVQQLLRPIPTAG